MAPTVETAQPATTTTAVGEHKDTWYHVSLLSVVAEFLFTLLFAFFGAWGGATLNGLALAVLVYGSASISGGHLNPW